METVLSDLLNRLDQFSNQFNDLRDGIRQAIKIAQDDPEMSLTRARKVLEYIVRDIYENKLNQKAGTQPLENLLQRVVKEGVFPKRLAAYATAVRELGNVGTHSFDEEITDKDVLQSLTSLMPIVEWFFEQKNAEEPETAGDRPMQQESPKVSARHRRRRRGELRQPLLRGGARGRWQLARLVVLAGVIAGGIVLIGQGKGGAADKNPLLISSLNEENRLAQAVGLVVICNRVFLPNGGVVEIPTSTGTGFAVTPDGYLLTARYVVEGASTEKTSTKISDVEVEVDKPILVYFRKVRFEAKVVYTSKHFNLAVLKVERRKQDPFFSLSAGDELKSGTVVSTLGYSGRISPEAGEQLVDPKRLEKAFQDAHDSHTSVYAESLLDEARFELNIRSGPVQRTAKNDEGVAVIYHEAKIFQGGGGGPLVEPNGTAIGINTHAIQSAGETTYGSAATGQLRAELEEFLLEKLVWKE